MPTSNVFKRENERHYTRDPDQTNVIFLVSVEVHGHTDEKVCDVSQANKRPEYRPNI